MINFKNYLKKIEIEVSEIPENNLILWGCLSVANSYNISKDILKKHLSDVEIEHLSEIIDYLWNVVDEKALLNVQKLDLLYSNLNLIDESDLDRTNFKETALYELIIGLDAILSYCITRERGFEFNLSQANINVIDAKLNEQDIDIFTSEGFKNKLLQNEIATQFKMINSLKTGKLNGM